jgi:hypothetical protein
VATEGFRTVAIAFIALGASLGWQAVRAAAIPVQAPERLIAELRLAQFGALLLVMSAGAYVGFAVSHEQLRGVGFDIALSVGFFVTAATTLLRDPRQALVMLAVAFAAHAVFDVAHRPGWLPHEIVPRWYAIGCALYDVVIGALCYFPILRRP